MNRNYRMLTLTTLCLSTGVYIHINTYTSKKAKGNVPEWVEHHAHHQR
jgi:hypothetical protein